MCDRIQLLVLGTGCSKCNQLYAATEQAAKEAGVAYELHKVSDLKQIMALQVMITPALMVNGQLRVAGRAASVEEIKKLLTT